MIAWTSLPWILLGAALVIGAGLAIVLVSYATLRASATPDELLGRVGSTARMVTLGLQPIGLLAGGALIEASGAADALVAMGSVVVVASLVFGLSRTFRGAGH